MRVAWHKTAICRYPWLWPTGPPAAPVPEYFQWWQQVLMMDRISTTGSVSPSVRPLVSIIQLLQKAYRAYLMHCGRSARGFVRQSVGLSLRIWTLDLINKSTIEKAKQSISFNDFIKLEDASLALWALFHQQGFNERISNNATNNWKKFLCITFYV